jgi:uncharacterized membrane protein
LRTRLLKLRDSLTGSLWFVPVILTAGAVILSFVAVYIDRVFESRDIQLFWLFYTGETEGAREVLSVIASSMITVAGVVFSITIVALTLASQQFGPRLLRNFMRDTGNQVVLGTFIATFVYCILVLRTARGSEYADFVPSISVTLGVLLALASLGVLIFFIHHVALSIQATTIIGHVHRELNANAERIFPEMLGEGDEEPEGVEDFLSRKVEGGSTEVHAVADGYLQAVVNEKLMKIATTREVLIHFIPRPGDYVIKGQTIASVWPVIKDPDDEMKAQIHDCLVLGSQRSPTQDIRFLFEQLTEIAVRALSTGINDPYTAMNCIDRLGSGLALLAGRKIPSPFRYDEERALRVIARPITFVEIVDLTLDPVRQYGNSSPAVLNRMLEMIETLAPFIKRIEDRAALNRHVQLIQETVSSSVRHESDRKTLKIRSSSVLKALSGGRMDPYRQVEGQMKNAGLDGLDFEKKG